MKRMTQKAGASHGALMRERAAKSTPRQPRAIKCDDCGQNYVSKRGEICEGCDAYREHTGHF